MQFRFLDGATALAIVTAVANSWLQDVLHTIVRTEQVAMIFRDSAFIDSLPDTVQGTVRGLFVKGFNLQMRILSGFATAQFPVTMLMWQRSYWNEPCMLSEELSSGSSSIHSPPARHGDTPSPHTYTFPQCFTHLRPWEAVSSFMYIDLSQRATVLLCQKRRMWGSILLPLNVRSWYMNDLATHVLA